MKSYFIIYIVINCNWIVLAEEFLPILLWHSAGETCCENEFQTYSNVIRKHLSDNVYIKSIQLSSNMRSDKIKSLTMHPFEQIKIACDLIRNDIKFYNGYNAIGLSQGALLLRGLAEICPFPKMRNLISLGGPHQGIFQYPQCGKISTVMCATLHFQINILVYRRSAQNLLTPATYWHDLNENRYRNGSTFLAIINNEKEINVDFAENLKALKKFVLVRYEQDNSVVPSESAFFGFWDEHKQVVKMEESELYRLDKLGLKVMNERKQLVFLTSPGSHLEFNEEWFAHNIIEYFK